MLPPRPQGHFRRGAAHYAGAPRLRRKTLLNALSAAFPLDKEALRGCIEAAGLPPDIRGERLSIPQFAALADQISAAL